MKKLYVVGLGPGETDSITQRAKNAIKESSVIVGYDLYVKQIASLVEGKRVESTPMRREVERCRIAVEAAAGGETTAMVCSGDAGVYGMAGIVLEVAQQSHPEVAVEVIPGITAACSGAAVLGAPLIHDFAVVSLSDLLTPWEKIETRLRCAAEADFVICLYNPSSKKRADYLARACAIVMQFRDEKTPCGWVRQIGREGETWGVCTLGEMASFQADMFTTVFLGNSQTKVVNGRLVTPRGYRLEQPVQE